MIKLTSSRHAKTRARQRIRWKPRTVDRMLERVLYDGLGPEDCPRRLRLHDFIVSTAEKDTGMGRVYGEHLFVFGKEAPDELRLITVYPIPVDLKPSARDARLRHHALAA